MSNTKSPMPTSYGYDTYLSPFSWRYGSEQMRHLWSEQRKEELRRLIWVAWAETLHEIGLVSEAELLDLARHSLDVDISRIHAFEVKGNHDVMAALTAFAEQCPVGGGKLHLGMTSEDTTCNLDVIRMRAGVEMLIRSLTVVLENLVILIRQHAGTRCTGWTHIQAASPTTYGHRFAERAQELLECFAKMHALLKMGLRPKGLKGATGSRVSFTQLLKGRNVEMQKLEEDFLLRLKLPAAFTVTGQTYPREQDLELLQLLSLLAATLHKFAQDLRILMSTPFGEVRIGDPRAQKGSSAMPWKVNPIDCENICSLARLVEAFAHAAWMNASSTVLERSLDDSASRRIFIPEAFLAVEEILIRTAKVTQRLVINRRVTDANVDNMGMFLGLEGLIAALVRDYGMDRQVVHELIREAALTAMDHGTIATPAAAEALLDQLTLRLAPTLYREQIRSIILDTAGDTGDASDRAREVAETIENALAYRKLFPEAHLPNAT